MLWLFLLGCSSPEVRATTHLEERYGESFEIQSMERVTGFLGTRQGWQFSAVPTSGSEPVFYGHILRDGSIAEEFGCSRAKRRYEDDIQAVFVGVPYFEPWFTQAVCVPDADYRALGTTPQLKGAVRPVVNGNLYTDSPTVDLPGLHSDLAGRARALGFDTDQTDSRLTIYPRRFWPTRKLAKLWSLPSTATEQQGRFEPNDGLANLSAAVQQDLTDALNDGSDEPAEFIFVTRGRGPWMHRDTLAETVGGLVPRDGETLHLHMGVSGFVVTADPEARMGTLLKAFRGLPEPLRASVPELRVLVFEPGEGDPFASNERLHGLWTWHVATGGDGAFMRDRDVRERLR